MPHAVPAASSSLLELAIELDRESATPLAVQLADALRTAATDGQVRGGDRLPSTRALARHLGVSRTVTAAAYEQLHAEGWIVGHRGSGTYVTTTPPGAAGAGRGPTVRATAADAGAVDLTPGSPWVGGLDKAAWRRGWRACADAPPLPKPVRAGLPEYREAVVEHLLRHRGLVVDEPRGDAVLVTGGTSAAVTELAVAVFGRNCTIAVEDPGYQRAVNALRALGVSVVPVPVDHGGIVVEAIPSGVSAVYCSPAHQYPIGGRLPADRRIALVERARAHGWLIIEDDYDGELRYDVAPLPVLVSMAPDVVVHLGTTSKILTPTLGVGWMLAPPEVGAAVLEHREVTAIGPAAAGQRFVAEFARNGDLGRHLRRLRRELSQRRAMLVDTLAEHDVAVFGDQAGAHVVLGLPDVATERRMIADARQRGVVLDGLERHHQDEPVWCGVALGYAACSREELRRALELVPALYREG
ncbi:aminotransferase class I/II-fold pyridoxal phosphate-dependent enzyme [Allosaccharopolyspora coralli]|uniref:Aminotransferase class I/II-fold pyridoxal phosphate-dependent enzyme n=1 Tax=Allosaccharopolyspora coralli TaxID=2665642 RepID=A0A5Q3QD25_9PSEU|nr:PLP-dependent aminotransferase family protein [Allosaccharopolyspora coralli]QGK71084.1 aminotransferase class I/II-fold pyridoxal phosphate-dependent enzyme [Allosaccharopolyspora coralli]